MNDERRRIKFLTQVTGDFHGLKMIAFGFIQIIIASLNYLADLDSQKRDFAGKDITFPIIFLLLCVFVGLALKPSVRNYLTDKFGRAVQKPPTIEKRLQIWMCVIPIVFGFLVSVWVDASYSLSFSLTVLTVAITTFIFWLEAYRGISNTSLYLSMIFLIFSFLPWEKISAIFNMTNGYPARAAFYQNLLSLFLGISYLTIGLDDIRLVFSMMKPIEKEQDYESF